MCKVINKAVVSLMVHFQYTHWVMNVKQILLHSVSILEFIFHSHQIKIYIPNIDFDNRRRKWRLSQGKSYWLNLYIKLVSWNLNSQVDTLWGCLFYKGLECERPSRVAWWTLFTHMTATLILSWEWELQRRKEQGRWN